MEIKKSFRPLIRGFFFYVKTAGNGTSVLAYGFRPLIRGFFFYDAQIRVEQRLDFSVSVPSFGDSFFIRTETPDKCGGVDGFRPLIRGFFFYAFVVTPLLKTQV